MKSRPDRVHKLHSGHFAFMRAVVQGIDAQVAWERYLQLDVEHSDGRLVGSAIASIRSEFAAAAKRQARPGTARLVLLDVEKLTGAQGPTPAPTLAEFAAQRGMQDFSEAEQAEAFADEFGVSTRRSSRRVRLIARQLEALRWLEELVAEEPKPGDGVEAWLAPSMAARISAAGMPTLFALAQRINGSNGRWWAGIPGVGKLKAERIVQWLRQHDSVAGLQLGEHVALRHAQIQPGLLAVVASPSTALVPFENFLVPAELDGRAGRFRAPRELCMLNADNDYRAIGAWLGSKRAGEPTEPLSPTQRSYRREAERLLLWAVLVARKPLSSLEVEDASAFTAFLQAPPATWCGPRHQQRGSPLWRPLEGPLSDVSLRQALTILRSLFAFLVKQNYQVGNPFAGVAQPRESGRALGSTRTLSFAQWDAISRVIKSERETPADRRRGRAVLWLYATGLRLSELTAARCSNLERIDLQDDATGWLLTVKGKGNKIRQVPVPAPLVAELGSALAAAGRSADPLCKDNAPVPILANVPEGIEPWSGSGLYKALKVLFERCALQLQGRDADQLRKASPHWLRHSHGSHALNGRPGQEPVPAQVVQNNLGHSSIGTTSGYLRTELEDRLKAMQGFWSGSPS